MEKIALGLAALLAVFLLANGTFMVVAPEAWYWAVPGVPDRGPFNQHFVRDIGIIYLLMGVGFAGGIAWRDHRTILWAAASTWLIGHAIFHVWEVVVGICSPSALIQDFVGVILVALLAAALAFWSRRGHA